MPDFFISSSAMPSSLATALSTALSGSGIAGTNGGGTSDCAEAVGGGAGCAGLAPQPAARARSRTTTAVLASAFMSCTVVANHRTEAPYAARVGIQLGQGSGSVQKWSR